MYHFYDARTMDLHVLHVRGIDLHLQHVSVLACKDYRSTCSTCICFIMSGLWIYMYYMYMFHDGRTVDLNVLYVSLLLCPD